MSCRQTNRGTSSSQARITSQSRLRHCVENSTTRTQARLSCFESARRQRGELEDGFGASPTKCLRDGVSRCGSCRPSAGRLLMIFRAPFHLFCPAQCNPHRRSGSTSDDLGDEISLGSSPAASPAQRPADASASRTSLPEEQAQSDSDTKSPTAGTPMGGERTAQAHALTKATSALDVSELAQILERRSAEATLLAESVSISIFWPKARMVRSKELRPATSLTLPRAVQQRSSETRARRSSASVASRRVPSASPRSPRPRRRPAARRISSCGRCRRPSRRWASAAT